MRAGRVIVVLMAMGWLLLSSQGQNLTEQAPVASRDYIPVHKYAAERDAATDIQQAISEARKTGKNILLEVGGDWCPWCSVLERFYERHSDIVARRENSFITVYVYYGSDKKNEKALGRYPKVDAIPHFFVLDPNGQLLHSQSMIELETGGEPDSEKIKAFLTRWSPAFISASSKPAK
jgi:thiol:disulfide interchange protein